MPVCVRLQQGRDEPSRCRRLRTVSWFPFLGCQPYFCTWERFSVAKTLETFYVDLFIKTTHCSLARPSRQRSLTARAALRRRGSALGDIRLRRHGDSGRPGAAAFGPRSLAAVHRAARNLRPHGRPRGPARRDPSLRFSTLLRFCRERRRTSEDRRPTSSSTQPLDRPGHEHDASVPKAQDFRVPRHRRRFALPAILPGSASGNDARSRRRPSRTGVRNRSGIFPRRKPVNPAKKIANHCVASLLRENLERATPTGRGRESCLGISGSSATTRAAFTDSFARTGPPLPLRSGASAFGTGATDIRSRAPSAGETARLSTIRSDFPEAWGR